MGLFRRTLAAVEMGTAAIRNLAALGALGRAGRLRATVAGGGVVCGVRDARIAPGSVFGIGYGIVLEADHARGKEDPERGRPGQGARDA